MFKNTANKLKKIEQEQVSFDNDIEDFRLMKIFVKNQRRKMEKKLTKEDYEIPFTLTAEKIKEVLKNGNFFIASQR
ncbi:hypothetical protein AAEX28_14220 [Lentisphaerota bacterium WC36G]|nr:hypothetical protein LJT99_00975 [Lentisphaerae bacterium WC36]